MPRSLPTGRLASVREGLIIYTFPFSNRWSIDMPIGRIGGSNSGNGMRILLTGRSGYIGSVMVPFLVAGGHELVGVDTGIFADYAFGETSLGNPRDVRNS